MADSRLRTKAYEAIRAGRLPSYPPTRMNAGLGLGAICPVCGERVTREETGWELGFAPPPGAQGASLNCDVHISCFVAWELERQKFPVPRPVTAARQPALSTANHDGNIGGRAEEDADGQCAR